MSNVEMRPNRLEGRLQMNAKEIKQQLRKQASYLTDGWNGVDREFLEGKMRHCFDAWQREQQFDVDEETVSTVIKELYDDFAGYGPIQDMLNDPHVTEIMVNGPYKIYVEKNGRKLLTEARFEDVKHLQYVIDKMIAPSGRMVNKTMPCADFSLPGGSRVNVTLPPLAVNGISITVRKLVESIRSMADIVELGTLDVRMANFLIKCLRGRMNILFSGGTGTGKTTTINLLSDYIDEGERVVTIEDTLELNLKQGNLVRLLTRPSDLEGKGEVGLRYLFANSLRMRPSRIILGEIRGAEAMDYLQALNCGHKGTLAVLHASTPQDAVSRLETMSMFAGLDLPGWAIRRQIASGLQLIVQHEQLMDGSRKITCISEVAGIKDNEIVLNDIYRYELEETDSDSRIKGRFIAFGPPSFAAALKKQGMVMEDSLFAN
jgi:pilus assembly protein CpaF